MNTVNTIQSSEAVKTWWRIGCELQLTQAEIESLNHTSQKLDMAMVLGRTGTLKLVGESYAPEIDTNEDCFGGEVFLHPDLEIALDLPRYEPQEALYKVFARLGAWLSLTADEISLLNADQGNQVDMTTVLERTNGLMIDGDSYIPEDSVFDSGLSDVEVDAELEFYFDTQLIKIK